MGGLFTTAGFNELNNVSEHIHAYICVFTERKNILLSSGSSHCLEKLEFNNHQLEIEKNPAPHQQVCNFDHEAKIFLDNDSIRNNPTSM